MAGKKSGKKFAGAAPKSGGGALTGIVLPIALVVGVIALLASGALPALCLFLPALLWLCTEQEPGRPMTRTLLLFGLVGAWDSLDAFWHVGAPRPADWISMLDIRALTRAWVAQAMGWLLAEGLALLMAFQADREIGRARQSYQAEISQLRAEWGDGVSHAADDG